MSIIQKLLAQNPVWLAPMAGVNDAAFRALCKEFGAGLTFSEMVSSKGLLYRSSEERSLSLLKLHPNEVPAVIQIFGNDPSIMAHQADFIAGLLGEDLAFIDINMGCPVPKVAEKGDGAGLMRDIKQASQIVSEVAQALKSHNKQVSVKFRRGWSPKHENAVEFGQAMEQAGAALLTVHGRYREQFYHGTSNLETVGLVKDAVSIPVIASGDMLNAKIVNTTLQSGVCDGVMVARGAIGNPWIFREIRGGEPPQFEERLDGLLLHAQGIEEYLGPQSLKRIRRHASSYCAGLPGASFFRARLQEAESLQDIEELIGEYRSYIVAKKS